MSKDWRYGAENRFKSLRDFDLIESIQCDLLTTQTTEQILATIPLPAGVLLEPDVVGLELFAQYELAGNTNNKIMNVRVGGIGGAAILSRATATAADTTVGLVNVVELKKAKQLAPL